MHLATPFEDLDGADGLYEAAYRPLIAAIPDLERRDFIVMAGADKGEDWVGCAGHYIGVFEYPWLDIPPTQHIVGMRYHEFFHIVDEQIVEMQALWDIPQMMMAAKAWPIAPSLGREMPWLPPATLDGVLLTPQAAERSQRTIERVLAMHAALGKYNGQPPTREVLDLMRMVDHWHPHFMWYGPAGIGTTRGLRGFEDFHQIPFLVAFPDRRGDPAIGHFIRIGDGNYAVTGGWGYLQATHTGDNFLGIGATGKRIKMRVMDFYRCDEQTIVENWIPMDIPHILLQMGIDVFGRMRHQFRQHEPSRVSEWLVWP